MNHRVTTSGIEFLESAPKGSEVSEQDRRVAAFLAMKAGRPLPKWAWSRFALCEMRPFWTPNDTRPARDLCDVQISEAGRQCLADLAEDGPFSHPGQRAPEWRARLGNYERLGLIVVEDDDPSAPFVLRDIFTDCENILRALVGLPPYSCYLSLDGISIPKCAESAGLCVAE